MKKNWLVGTKKGMLMVVKISCFKNRPLKLGTVVHACNPSTKEAEAQAGGDLILRQP